MLAPLQLRNEWRFLGRHPLLWLALAGAVAMSSLVANGSPAPSGSTSAEALLRASLFIPAFILPFIAAALGPAIFLREVEHDMGEIIGSYPLPPGGWLSMRLGSYMTVLLAACILSQFAILALVAPDATNGLPDLFFQSLVWLAVVHIPACLLWACLFARLSSATGSPGMLYFGAGFGWVAYIVIASLTGTPLIAGSYVAWEPLRQALFILDPYAITALVNPMPENGLLQSRIANIASGRLVMLLLCLWLLHGITELPSRANRVKKATIASKGWQHIIPEKAGPLFRPSSHLGLHLQYFVRDRIFPLLIGGWLLLLGSETYGGIGYAEPLAQIIPDSRDALNRVMWDIVPMAAALLLCYAADRVCRMYPALRMHELVAATPRRSSSMVTVHLFTLWAITFMFLALAGVAVAAAQLAAHSRIQRWEYMIQLGLALPPLLLLGMIFAATHALIRLRFVANLANLLIILLGFTSLAPSLGLYHPLWRPLATPLVAPDHYWGFESGAAGYLPLLSFWLGIGLALLMLAMIFNHRGMAFAQVRWRAAMRKPTIALLLFILAGTIIQGGTIHRQLAAEGLPVDPDERQAQRADYERHYAHWADTPQPDIAAVRFNVDFDPSGNSARLRAVMTLINRTDEPIEEILIGRNQIITTGRWSLAGATVAHIDPRLGQTVFRLHRPMSPRDTRILVFTAQFGQSGLTSASMPLVLRPSFSSLPAHALLPVVGFKRELTLRDPETRHAQGLPALHLTPPSKLPPQPARLAGNSATFESLVTTTKLQHAIGPGKLVRSWRANGRNHFLYRSTGAMRNMPAFYSLPWRPQIFAAGPTTVEAYAPVRLSEDDPNLLAIHDTLNLLGREVAPYPSHSLRLITVPEIGLSGYALPQTIQLSHRLAIRAFPLPDAGFSQTYRRAAHETAHQWFGHRIGHGIAEERAFLVESLAKYTELVVIEHRFGGNAMRTLVAYERDRYRQARLDPAAPVTALTDAEENEDSYSRATLAFACLRQQVGDKPILAAIRTITRQSERTGRPVRSIDFVEALVAASDQSAAKLIYSLFLDRAPLADGFIRSGCDLERLGFKTE